MSADIKRLGAYVLARREMFGLTQQEVADQGGPSDTTLSKLETGIAETVSPRTLKKLDTGLGWKKGSARAVLYGGEPTDAIPPQVVHVTDDTPRAREFRDIIADVERRMAELQATVSELRGEVERDDQ